MTSKQSQSVIGVLSDTHGRLDRRIFGLFEGVVGIIHAGDVGMRDILIELNALAPTLAVLGNTDQGGDCRSLPLQGSRVFAGLKVFATHGHLHSDPSQRISRILESTQEIAPDLVVVGHSHRPYVGVHDGVTFLNPGSASQPRHGHVASVALVSSVEGRPRVQVIDLDGNEIPTDTQI